MRHCVQLFRSMSEVAIEIADTSEDPPTEETPQATLTVRDEPLSHLPARIATPQAHAALATCHLRGCQHTAQS